MGQACSSESSKKHAYACVSPNMEMKRTRDKRKEKKSTVVSKTLTTVTDHVDMSESSMKMTESRTVITVTMADNSKSDNDSDEKSRSLFRFGSRNRWADDSVQDLISDMTGHLEMMQEYNALHEKYNDKGCLTVHEEQKYISLKLSLNQTFESYDKPSI